MQLICNKCLKLGYISFVELKILGVIDLKIKNKLLVLGTSTALLFSLLNYSGGPSKTAYAAGGEGSTIAGVPVGGLSSDEIEVQLQNAIMSWVAQPVTVTGAGESIDLNIVGLQYNVDGTVATFESLTDKPWYAFWQKDKVVNIPLEVMQSDSIKDQLDDVQTWDLEPTYNNVINELANLGSHVISAQVNASGAIDNERIGLVIEPIPTTAIGVADLIAPLNDLIITGEQTFSLNEALSNVSSLANEDAMNFVASTVYSAALQSNAMLVERHSQSKVPSYLEPGVEAKVTTDGQKDLRFTIPGAVKLKATIEDQNLKIETYAANTDLKSSIRVVRTAEVAPRVIERYSNDLPVGREVLEQEGVPGVRVAVYRTNASTGVETVVSNDYYPPTHRVVVKSARVPEATSSGDGTITDSESFVPTNPSNPDTGIDMNGDGLVDYYPPGTEPGDYPTGGTNSGSGNGSSNASGSGSSSNNGSTNGSGSNVTEPQYDKGGNLISK